MQQEWYVAAVLTVHMECVVHIRCYVTAMYIQTHSRELYTDHCIYWCLHV